MKRRGEAVLLPGDSFPALHLNLLTGEKLLFPGNSGGKWTVLLLHCDSSCPACRQQLVEFQKVIRDSRTDNVRVLAASSGDRDEALQSMWNLNISFPVAYGVSAARMRSSTGAVYNRKKGGIHPTVFLVDPDGRVANAFYGGSRCPADWLRGIDWLGLPDLRADQEDRDESAREIPSGAIG